jgi:hypothetical protein
VPAHQTLDPAAADPMALSPQGCVHPRTARSQVLMQSASAVDRCSPAGQPFLI